MSKIIRVMGIDPSLTATGWIVCDVDVSTSRPKIVDIIEMGLSETAPSKLKGKDKARVSSDNLARARTQRNCMTAAIENHKVQIACSEVPSGAQSAKAALAFGIVIGLLAALPVPMVEVSPLQVKETATGDRYADKPDIMQWALELTKRIGGMQFWKFSSRPNDFQVEHEGEFLVKKMEHQADAAAVVVASIATPEFKELAKNISSI